MMPWLISFARVSSSWKERKRELQKEQNHCPQRDSNSRPWIVKLIPIPLCHQIWYTKDKLKLSRFLLMCPKSIITIIPVSTIQTVYSISILMYCNYAQNKHFSSEILSLLSRKTLLLKRLGSHDVIPTIEVNVVIVVQVKGRWDSSKRDISLTERWTIIYSLVSSLIFTIACDCRGCFQL